MDNYTDKLNLYYLYNTLKKSLLKASNNGELIEIAVKKVHELMQVQIASIYLTDKNGYVSRRGLIGNTHEGSLIHHKNFITESYQPGESFSSKAVPKTNILNVDESFGIPEITEDLNEYKISSEIKEAYTNTFGSLTSAISIPLNGTNRTYGTLEVINKKKSGSTINKFEAFTHQDINELIVMANCIANQLTLFRRSEENKIFLDLSHKSINFSTDNFSEIDNFYKFVVNSLTSDIFPYRCCILRKINKGRLEVAHISAPEIPLEERDNSSREINSESLVGKVYQFKERIVIAEVNQSNNCYDINDLNGKWIKKHFRTHACFPLLAMNNCVGTLSIFTSYEHLFYPNEEVFIKALCSLIASLIFKSTLETSLLEAEEDLLKEKDTIIKALHFTGTNFFIQEISHRYKNELVSLKDNLIEIQDIPNNKRMKLIDEQVTQIRKRIDDIGKAFSTPDTLDWVDINQTVRKIIKLVKHYAKKISIPIDIKESYYTDSILSVLNQVNIDSVIYNILINSVNAIADSNHKKGLIEISTGLVSTRDKSDPDIISIIIRDDGIGMDKNTLDNIFKRGFSTTENRGGTGIGLYVCREIVNIYEGNIDVWSELGKGTVFTIEIPIKDKKNF